MIPVTLQVALRTVARVLRRLEASGKARRTGAGRVTWWEITKTGESK